MKQYERDYKLNTITDENSNIDLDYYLGNSQQLRNQAVRAQTDYLVRSFKNVFASLNTTFTQSKTVHKCPQRFAQ